MAWSSLGRGFFSGRVRSADAAGTSEVLDAPARTGYAHQANFDRLRRAELVAAEKSCTVPQLAIAWVLAQPGDPLAVVKASGAERVRENVAALDIELSEAELAYPDLRAEDR